MKSWKFMVKRVSECSPQLSEEIKNVNIWWAIQFRGQEFGISILRATKLHRNDLSKIIDLWNVKECGFKSWEEARKMFGCEEAEKAIWNIIMSSLFEELTCPTTQTRKGSGKVFSQMKKIPTPMLSLQLHKSFSHDAQTWWKN
jgi:hypothetical protein